MSKKIHVLVQYVGNDDFQDEVPAEQPLHAIKVRAMKKFDLDPDSGEKYTLQHNGIDVDDHIHIELFELDNVTFTLVLKKEVPKG